jgi:hypothetical protein
MPLGLHADRPAGPPARPAVPFVREFLVDIARQPNRPYSGRDPQLRSAAFKMYGAIGAGAADAVPDLIAEINRPRPAYSTGLAGIASQSLGRIGPAARAALPDLEKLLTHKELGPDAALAIWLIAPDDRSA